MFKNKIGNPQKDWDTIIEIFKAEIYLNKHQYIWIKNKICELIDKLGLDDADIVEIKKLIVEYKINEDKFKGDREFQLPLAERIFKDEKELKLLSKEKYDLLQDIFYVKELGVGYIRRGEYEKAIGYYGNLFGNDFLYFKYHAYKQLGRIFDEMDDPDNFKRIYDSYIGR